MRVFIAGSRGFVGRHVAQALARHSGIEVVHGMRRPQPGLASIPFDFRTDQTPEAWASRLDGVDAVVVCVGVLRQTRQQPIEALHDLGPSALFRACQARGIPVHHVSALGIEHGEVPYAATKRRAEATLGQLTAQDPSWRAHIYQPSIVFGRGGASSSLFMNLARLPALLMPGPVLQTAIQPVWVQDLADAIALEVRDGASQGPGLHRLQAVGETALPMGEFIASLRHQLGHGRAWQCPMPGWMVQASAWLGDQVEASPWCHETLGMLGTPNTGDVSALRARLGRPLLPLEQFVDKAWRQG